MDSYLPQITPLSPAPVRQLIPCHKARVACDLPSAAETFSYHTRRTGIQIQQVCAARGPHVMKLLSLGLALMVWANCVCLTGLRGVASATRAKQVPFNSATTDPSVSEKQAIQSQASETYGRLPLRFESNQGQTDERARFISRGNNFNVFLTPSAAIVAFYRGSARRTDKYDLNPPAESKVRTEILKLGLAGADPQAKISGVDELASKTNYFIGDNPKKWRTNVRNFSKVKYEDVYPGIDLVYYGNQRQLEQDFVISPGANPGTIGLTFDGAKRLRVSEKGE